MRFHEPEFPPDNALYIIWADDPLVGKRTVAAGDWDAMAGAWAAVQHLYPRALLTLQNRARVIREREPIGKG